VSLLPTAFVVHPGAQGFLDVVLGSKPISPASGTSTSTHACVAPSVPAVACEQIVAVVDRPLQGRLIRTRHKCLADPRSRRICHGERAPRAARDPGGRRPSGEQETRHGAASNDAALLADSETIL
jgi:hypothetical protein